MMRLVRNVAARIAALPLDLRIVLLVVAVVHGLGISWGMPASDAWDNDGVAPRDFLPGLASTYTPGDYYTYPPFHLALLALLTAPVTITAAVKVGSTRVPDVLHEIIQPPYMTVMAMTARIVALLMSVGIVLVVAKLAEEIAPDDRKRRAPAFAAAVAGLGISFTYYSHTSNLDVPYIFWGSLAALALVRDRWRAFAVYAAFAVATKDQAYALFVLTVPVVFGAHLRRDRSRLREALIAAAIGIALLLLIDGAITNPSGFRARLVFLAGSASQDFATYEKNAGGWLNILVDTAKELRSHYAAPIFFGGLYVLGAWEAIRRTRRLEAWIPLLVALSFTIFFNLQARRVEERFTLPQVVFLAPYAGIALAQLVSARSRMARWLVRGAIASALGLALYTCIELDANLVLEPRYDTEAFLRANAKPGDVVELHGLNVYLPRIQPGAKFVRVGPTDPAKRGPIPGLEEIQAPYSAIATRQPKFIVISECWVWRYLPDIFAGTPDGRIQPKTQKLDAADEDAVGFYGSLFGGVLPYRVAHAARFEHSFFRRHHLHASVGCPVYTFQRDEPDGVR